MDGGEVFLMPLVEGGVVPEMSESWILGYENILCVVELGICSWCKKRVEEWCVLYIQDEIYAIMHVKQEYMQLKYVMGLKYMQLNFYVKSSCGCGWYLQCVVG